MAAEAVMEVKGEAMVGSGMMAARAVLAAGWVAQAEARAHYK